MLFQRICHSFTCQCILFYFYLLKNSIRLLINIHLSFFFYYFIGLFVYILSAPFIFHHLSVYVSGWINSLSLSLSLSQAFLNPLNIFPMMYLSPKACFLWQIRLLDAKSKTKPIKGSKVKDKEKNTSINTWKVLKNA